MIRLGIARVLVIYIYIYIDTYILSVLLLAVARVVVVEFYDECTTIVREHMTK